MFLPQEIEDSLCNDIGSKAPPSSSDHSLDTATKVQPAAMSFFPKSMTALLGV